MVKFIFAFIDPFFYSYSRVKNYAFIVKLEIFSFIQFFVPLRLTNEKLRRKKERKKKTLAQSQQ